MQLEARLRAFAAWRAGILLVGGGGARHHPAGRAKHVAELGPSWGQLVIAGRGDPADPAASSSPITSSGRGPGRAGGARSRSLAGAETDGSRSRHRAPACTSPSTRSPLSTRPIASGSGRSDRHVGADRRLSAHRVELAIVGVSRPPGTRERKLVEDDIVIVARRRREVRDRVSATSSCDLGLARGRVINAGRVRAAWRDLGITPAQRISLRHGKP